MAPPQEQTSTQDPMMDIATRIRDIEEKQRLMKEKTALISKNFLDEKGKNSSEIQDLKKTLTNLEQENSRMKELLQSIIEQVNNLAKKEELMILQRQFDLFRKA